MARKVRTLVMCLAIIAAAAAVGGCLPLNFSAGPQAAWTWGRGSGLAWGWEAGTGMGIQRLNLGQTYGQGGNLSYAVLEPHIMYVGGTLGLGYDTSSGVDLVAGVWEGLPLLYPNDCWPETKNKLGLLVTVALGYRFGSEHQLYVTPKIGLSPSMRACERGPVTFSGDFR
ncbi:MAG: hypothetical protein MJD61_21395 [Proteobacteria bacterium]|nr:hypothetical protein [Pseudomonadota bacterium]